MSNTTGRISEGMSYGEVVTMFPMTRTVFAQKGIVEKPNFYYVPVSCFVEAYEISIDELNEVVAKTEEKRPECTVRVNGEVLSDRMTFTEILTAHPRVRGIFETYGIYETGKRNMNWKKETLGSIALSLNTTPEKFLNQIASCIKAPFFPLGNVFVLTMATLAFGLSFGLWVVMGPLSSIIKTEFALSFTQNSVMIALPILMGSVMRIPMGMLTDAYGGRIVMSGLLLFCSIVAACGFFVHSYAGLLVVGFFYGMCGTSFAIGIAQVTRWYPAHNQGLALAIFGTGNIGTVLATLFAAKMVKGWFGGDWHPAFPIYALPLLIMAFVYFFTVKNAPVPAAAKKFGQMMMVFKYPMVWVLCLFYFVTFGYFVCFSLYLAPLYKFTFNLTPTTAGYMAAIFCFIASVTRPIGGWTSDKWGGGNTLIFVFVTVIATLAIISIFNFTGFTNMVLMTLIMAINGFMLGVGNGAVYKLIPQSFPIKTGVVGGLVGCFGGLGGWSGPQILGLMRDALGHDGGGFLILLVISVVCLLYCLTKRIRHPVAID